MKQLAVSLSNRLKAFAAHKAVGREPVERLGALSLSNGQRAPPFSEFETGAGMHFDSMDTARNYAFRRSRNVAPPSWPSVHG